MFFNTSCKDKSRFFINTQQTSTPISIERFDKDIYSLQSGNYTNKIDSLYHTYGPFVDIYTQHILEIGLFRNTGESIVTTNATDEL